MRKIILAGGLILVTTCCFAQDKTVPQSQDKMSKLILGTWISDEDKAFTMRIYKDSIVQFNRGEDVKDFYRYTINAEPCDTTINTRSATGYYLNETAIDGQSICSYIEVLDEKLLTLNFNWGAMLLHFKKKTGK
ncbi:MAG TPA: hypothetical protein VNZ45_09020 [Bacteroidia bacterium]|jgi:hypothetical protein|nr:hypothetical protein [Bacteroidia bacterium]